ncbi:MAG TPA: nitroreductase family protein [Negativicutes bacterium]|nr:nitroreductase family protein [Negativicutes bacterium]
MFKDIVRKNRSYRRFFEHEPISRETLLALVDLARLVPSGANKQALKYYLSCTGELNEKIFRTLGWAGYLQDWPGPAAGERPAAYIVIVQDAGYPMTTVIDYGIAAQTILLGAVEMGFGGCLFGNIQKAQLREILDVPEDYEILLVIALGRPKETVVIDEIARDGDIKYWRDQKQIHHVPKRKLKDVIMN